MRHGINITTNQRLSPTFRGNGNTIIVGDSQTSPVPIFLEGGGTSVHRLTGWELLAGNRTAALPRHARGRRIMGCVCKKNLKSRLNAANFFLSEVADKSFCVKFSGLDLKSSKNHIKFREYSTYTLIFGLFKANKIYGAPMKPSELFCFKDTKISLRYYFSSFSGMQ